VTVIKRIEYVGYAGEENLEHKMIDGGVIYDRRIRKDLQGA
jgi:hypothetical protein